MPREHEFHTFSEISEWRNSINRMSPTADLRELGAGGVGQLIKHGWEWSLQLSVPALSITRLHLCPQLRLASGDYKLFDDYPDRPRHTCPSLTLQYSA